MAGNAEPIFLVELVEGNSPAAIVVDTWFTAVISRRYSSMAVRAVDLEHAIDKAKLIRASYLAIAGRSPSPDTQAGPSSSTVPPVGSVFPPGQKNSAG